MEVLYIKLRLIRGIISVIVVFFSSFVILHDEYVLYYEESNNKGNRLVIPAIEFDMIIYDSGLYNDVDSNIELLDGSDKSNNLYFFAGHSGNGDNCYFNRVKELVYGDIVYVYMDGRELSYKVIDSYNIVKIGYIEVIKDISDEVYLITCNDYGGQLIVKGVLIN